MPKFRLASLSQLARQMTFAPHEVRLAQINRAELLLQLIEPAKAYPLDFVIFKITDYRPKQGGDELLAGAALQHDLGLLIEQISSTSSLQAATWPEPVLAIDDVCAKFNVTSKTIQRWRRKGLAARRFIFPDGRQRVGFLLSSVERFLQKHGPKVAEVANIAPVEPAEREFILRNARRLLGPCVCTVDQACRRIARRLHRSPLTVLHTIKRHDQDHPSDAILDIAVVPISERDRLAVLKAFRRGTPLSKLAIAIGRSWASVGQLVLEDRIVRIVKRKVRFIEDPIFHEPEAERMIEAMLSADALPDASSGDETRAARDLPPELAGLYRTPLLTAAQERAMFLKLNLLKRRFVLARRRFDPELARKRELDALSEQLSRAAEVKKAIVRANLRLAVSIARKHLRPGVSLAELLSEGTLTLMRAVDGFDVSRGFRFSTYATLALMKGFARCAAQLRAGARGACGDSAILEAVADPHSTRTVRRLVERDEVRQLLGRLDDREREVLTAHFGLAQDAGPATYDQVAQRLGLSRERVRQIEQAAIAKLRALRGALADAVPDDLPSAS